ncbi:MAG TPA: DUF1003 domain-containing protein [Thermoanaerobaculia bacterium]|jgi:uncharacterized membrane protein
MTDRIERRSGPRPEMGGENQSVGEVVERNIRALLLRRRAEEQNKRADERLADKVTRFTGSMPFVYIHLFLVIMWVAVNLGWVPFVAPFDPTFVILASAASVEAIFLSTFVLISQNRMAALEAQRSDLDLQVSLLAEHEITRLITLVTAMAAKMEIAEARHPDLLELAKDVEPEAVLQTMEATAETIAREAREGRLEPES